MKTILIRSAFRRHLLASAAATCALLSLPITALAVCDIPTAKGDINIVGNSFPALQHIAKEMESCNRAGLKVSFKLTPQARVEAEQAFASEGKSPFDLAVVSNGVYAAMQSKGQLQPMTDLVAKYRTKYKIEEKMLIKVNGEVMAIAFMQNAQNLFYRKDVFAKYGIKVPSTYPEMLDAAKQLKKVEPSIEYPIAQTFAKGFDVGVEFINIFAGYGGKFFKPGSAQPDIVNDAGIKAMELMKSMTPFMTPNYLASNSDDVMNQFQQGKAVMGVLWASRAARMDDPAASKIVGRMDFGAAPAVVAGGKSATHLWWDGMVMPKNLAGDRDSAFQVMMEALDEQTMKGGNDLTIWTRSIYKPTRFGVGVITSGLAGAPIWPTEPYFGLLHSELGKVLPEVLAGTVSPRAGLLIVSEAYSKAAADKGFIK